MKRGDIYWANLAPRSGSEQAGRRPVIIVSDDAFNLSPSWMSLIGIPVSTSTRQARRSPTTVDLPKGSGGLTSNSVALCHQITTIDRVKFGRKIGELSPQLLRAVGEGIKAAMDLD